MAEEEKVTEGFEPAPILNVDGLLAFGKQIQSVMIGDKQVRIRALTWEQEYNITKLCASRIKEGTPESVADREYILFTVMMGVVEPKMEEKEVRQLKFGVIKKINAEIRKLSDGIEKK